MTDKITQIEWACLEGRRPRSAGSNARLGDHGIAVRVPLLRVTTADGATGFGHSWASQEEASKLLGQSVPSLFDAAVGVPDLWRSVEYPLWDLAGNLTDRPVYALAAKINHRPVPRICRVPTYDTSLYFDDLHLQTDEEAAALIAAEALEGAARGHRAFKIKVGRGARWMPLEEGTRRDIAVIRAVRAAVGPDAALLLDANNGWNLNLTKRVLSGTADCRIHWMEEAFHEDSVLYADLRAWLQAQGLSTLIADGEGDASPAALRWAREGLVNVIQYDVYGHGFTRWLETGRQLDGWGAGSAPHHYGVHTGNYAACHLAPALSGFTYAEWDETATSGLDGSEYRIVDGSITVPARPGFGLSLDSGVFEQAVEQGGWRADLQNAP